MDSSKVLWDTKIPCSLEESQHGLQPTSRSDMASIEKRTDQNGTISYRVKIRLKGHPARSATFPKLAQAKEWAKVTEAAILEDRHPLPSVMARKQAGVTLGKAVERYRLEVSPSKRDGEHQARQLDWWAERLGDHPLGSITPSMVAEARDILGAEGRAPATVVRYLAALSALYTQSNKEWGICEDNPVLKVRKPKEPRGRVRYLTQEEVSRLLAACRSHSLLYRAVMLSLATGARAGEILGLDWSDIHLDRRVAILHHTKNGERRVLSLAAPQALECLLEVPEADRKGKVFPSRKDPSKPIDLRVPFGKALQEAGIEDFHWHDLRHTAASHLAMSGASSGEIAEVLGHKTLAMVKRYAHLSDDHISGVAERLGSRLFGGRSGNDCLESVNDMGHGTHMGQCPPEIA